LVLVSKQPEKEFGGSASLGIWAVQSHSGAGRFHGSLTSDQKLYGRIIIAGLDEESSFDNLTGQARYGSPASKLDITTVIHSHGFLTDTYLSKWRGASASRGSQCRRTRRAANGRELFIPAIPFNQLGFLQPPWAAAAGKLLNTSLKYEHQFGDNWHLSIAGQATIQRTTTKNSCGSATSARFPTNRFCHDRCLPYFENERDSNGPAK